VLKRISRITSGLVLVVLAVATAQADITTGLVGYWPLDGDALDVSGNDLHGTINGAVTPVADRLDYANSAMSFTGAADCYISVPDTPKLQITGEMTLAAWVLLNKANTNNCRIIAKSGAGGARSYSLNIEASSGGVTFPATFQIGINGGASNISARDTQPLPTDEWVHMAGVYRPGEVMEVYVNGELHATNTADIPAQQYSNNSLPVMIGARNACSNCGWVGALDEARIYARALSATEINELVNFVPLPRVQAWSPKPADGAEAVENPLLEWKPGVTAVLHNVYVGKDPNLTEANLVGPRTPLLMQWYAPGLEPGQTYYWRVDEIEMDGKTVHTGNVWSFVALPLTAYHPEPANAFNAVPPTPTLTWRVGKGAAQHHLYLSDSSEAVAQGAADADKRTMKEATFAPGTLQSATVYYWRVDEIAVDGTVQAGRVWTFATFLSVDDFESYTDDEGGRIYETWIDGWTNSTGSTVGYVQAPFAEQTVIHSGKQSMPLDYNNVNTPFYSEAERSWSTQQDWTVNEVDTLVLHIRGRSSNVPEKLYLVLEDSAGHQGTASFPDSAVFTSTQWTEWKILLRDFSSAGVNLARIKKMYLGVGDRAAPVKGGAGRIYLDDICLTRP
jgi:hypothetical protein